jgi:hypothetical protein
LFALGRRENVVAYPTEQLVDFKARRRQMFEQRADKTKGLLVLSPSCATAPLLAAYATNVPRFGSI